MTSAAAISPSARPYTSSDRTNDQNLLARGTGKKREAWATGLKYDANNIYLATMYSKPAK